MAMQTPQTMNQHLDRMLVWFRLMGEMAVPPDKRSSSVRRVYRNAILNMTIVTSGTVGEPGHHCVSACCALGTAALNPYFNNIGLEPAKALVGVRLNTMNVMLFSESVPFTDRRLSALFGLSHDNYIRIVDPCKYGIHYEDDPITAHDVMDVMREVMIETFEIDPVCHPYITGKGKSAA
jgi:hypothetical protein